MSELESPYITLAIEETDTKSGFSCGKRPLDDYFARHAFPNHVGDIGRAYVLRKAADADANLPTVLGFSTRPWALLNLRSTCVPDVNYSWRLP